MAGWDRDWASTDSSWSEKSKKRHVKSVLLLLYLFLQFKAVLRIRIRDPESCAFLTPGSGIRDEFFPDPKSRISDPGSKYISESLVTIFYVKNM